MIKKSDPKSANQQALKQHAPETEKYVNYKNLIASFYDHGTEKHDIEFILRQITPDVDILNHLIDFEKTIDSLIKRKRFDLQQMNMKPDQKIKKLLRVHVINSFEKTGHKLKIKGYLFPRTDLSKQIKLTSFFKSMSFKFSNESYANHTWKKPTGSMGSIERDGFILNLNSNERTNLDITMVLLSDLPKFKIDPYLQKIVKMESGTRVAILEALWQYIKIHKLQDSENKESINTDENLKNAFKCQKIQFSTLNGRIRELLSPCEPLTISLSLSDRPEERIFDVIVELDSKAKVDAMPFLAQKSNQNSDKTTPENPYFYLNSKIKKIQKTIQDNLQKIRRHALKREIYRNFTKEKIEGIVMEQHQLLEELEEVQHNEDPNYANFLFQNEEEVEKEVKNLIEQSNLSKLD